MTADDLRARAAERRRVGWEISDAMTPTEMENLARQLDEASRLVGDATADMGRAIADEREACANVADYRAAICREAMSGPPESLPGVEVHTMNEALHIASMIRNRTTTA